jgi:hypothetical protein
LVRNRTAASLVIIAIIEVKKKETPIEQDLYQIQRYLHNMITKHHTRDFVAFLVCDNNVSEYRLSTAPSQALMPSNSFDTTTRLKTRLEELAKANWK